MRVIVFSLLILCMTHELAGQQKEYKLWYAQPAKDWNEALPVGNGNTTQLLETVFETKAGMKYEISIQ